jgi:nitrogen fixation/metabolism regulation signal transduction histidine kinase
MASSTPTPGNRLSHEATVLALALLAGLPGSLIGLFLLWRGDQPPIVQWSLSAALIACWFGFSWAARVRVARSLLTLANLLGALREGDFSLRALGSRHGDALDLALLEANELAEILQQQRLGALEASALLRRVIGEIEVGVFAFDEEHRLRVVNRWGERLLGEPAERLHGKTAGALGIEDCLDGEAVCTRALAFPGRSGRWIVRRSGFWQGGAPHQLLVLSDVSRALREEEVQAWQRLVRVLSHEINNSLTPISSLSQSLSDLLDRDPRPDDCEADLQAGLAIIAERSEGLRRVMASYAQLARLPPPRLAPVDVESWVRRVAPIETRLAVEVVPGPSLEVRADGDQLDQLLINLIRNGADAALETGGGVRVGWEEEDGRLRLWVEDDGPGLPESSNLFVPFFSTKPHGSGIGLVLSRQIAEAHAGKLSLVDRQDGPGCRAELALTLDTSSLATPVSQARGCADHSGQAPSSGG